MSPGAEASAAAAAAAANIATRGAGLAGGGGNGGGGGGASGDPALWAPKAAAAAAAAGSHQHGPDGQARFRIEDIPMISELVSHHDVMSDRCQNSLVKVPSASSMELSSPSRYKWD